MTIIYICERCGNWTEQITTTCPICLCKDIQEQDQGDEE